MRNVNLLLIWLGLIIGNLIYALATGEYSSAVERSFFQGGALLMVWLCAKLPGATHD